VDLALKLAGYAAATERSTGLSAEMNREFTGFTRTPPYREGERRLVRGRPTPEPRAGDRVNCIRLVRG
jgi:hypothetical protein